AVAFAFAVGLAFPAAFLAVDEAFLVTACAAVARAEGTFRVAVALGGFAALFLAVLAAAFPAGARALARFGPGALAAPLLATSVPHGRATGRPLAPLRATPAVAASAPGRPNVPSRRAARVFFTTSKS